MWCCSLWKCCIETWAKTNTAPPRCWGRWWMRDIWDARRDAGFIPIRGCHTGPSSDDFSKCKVRAWAGGVDVCGNDHRCHPAGISKSNAAYDDGSGGSSEAARSSPSLLRVFWLAFERPHALGVDSTTAPDTQFVWQY